MTKSSLPIELTKQSAVTLWKMLRTFAGLITRLGPRQHA
jgi:hypothetical protein